MFLSSVYLQNFRSYTKSSFEFSPEITVIVGPNTVGKTNILEAVFMLSTGKSFRAEKEEEVVKFDNEIARLGGELIDDKEEGKRQKLEIVFSEGRKKYLVNGVSKRQMDFVGMERAVLFSPQDLDLITDSPSLRRKYLDFVLVQADREYRRGLGVYEKGLRQRNKLLERIREEGVGRNQLGFWDELLIKNGNLITAKREEFINDINHQAKTVGDFNLIYDKSEISTERLAGYVKEEVLAGTTLVGPHRDDWKINTNKGIKELKNQEGLDISLFGSRGEQRMAVLWLKLCELEFVSEKTESRPILLLDDIFSELDKNHRKLIMEIIPKQQTIITTTDLDHIGKEFLEKIKVINL